MRQLAEGAQASMTEPLQTAIRTARREASAALGEVDVFIRERYPALRDDMNAFREAMSEIVRTLNALDRRLGRIAPVAPSGISADQGHQDVMTVLRQIAAALEAQHAPKPRPAEKPPLLARVLRALGMH
jgi:hypothetical protein